MSPHLELEFAAKAAVEGRASRREAVAAAERTPFVKAEGEGREFAHLQNSLKTLCQAWAEPTDAEHRDCVKSAIASCLSAIALWPMRVTAKAPVRRAACTSQSPTPWYVEKDL